MNATSTTEATHLLGAQAKAASAQMARASTEVKDRALRSLAALLRKSSDALQLDNAKDIARRTRCWFVRTQWWTASSSRPR